MKIQFENLHLLDDKEVVELVNLFGIDPKAVGVFGEKTGLLEYKQDDSDDFIQELNDFADNNEGFRTDIESIVCLAKRFDFEGVEKGLAGLGGVKTEVSIGIHELRAQNALLYGRVEDAYKILATIVDITSNYTGNSSNLIGLSPCDALRSNGNMYGGEGEALAMEMAQLLGQKLSIDIEPETWAKTQMFVGYELKKQSAKSLGVSKDELMTQAISAFKAALLYYTQENHPHKWAETLNVLGSSLQSNGIRIGGVTGIARLKEALGYFSQTVILHTKETDRHRWFISNYNRGIVLVSLGTLTPGNEGDLYMQKAKAAYREALTAYSKEDRARNWAKVQDCLGSVALRQGKRAEGKQRDVFFSEAVAAYKDALSVFSKTRHRLDWASSNSSLAAALQNQSRRASEDKVDEFLQQANAAFSRSLEVWTKEGHPIKWASVQKNLATLHLTRGGSCNRFERQRYLATALVHAENALQIYEQDVTNRQLGETRGLIARIHKAKDGDRF